VLSAPAAREGNAVPGGDSSVPHESQRYPLLRSRRSAGGNRLRLRPVRSILAVVATPRTRDPAEQLVDGRRFARPGTVAFGALILTATLCAAAYVLINPGGGLDSFTGRLGSCSSFPLRG
jgi:hypothetical protein